MELSVEQQIFEQIKKSQKILIALPQTLTADSLASGLALKLFLGKLQKDVSLASSGNLPKNLDFLPGAGSITKDVAAAKSFVISVNTAQKKLEELSYQSEGDKVNIYLKSRGGEFLAEDVSFASEKFPLDLIITLEAGSLEALGKFYEQHPDLFFETPKINIDNKSGNEYFGAINLVDITASSVAEILAGLLQKYEQQLVDQDIATCLLAGIIDKTGSFQHVHTTPRAFLQASELVALGGRQQEIIKHIYKTKSLPLLKLWGRALARMKIQDDKKIIHSVLALSDFERAEAGQEEILPVLKEFIGNISGYRLIAIIAENPKGQTQILAAVHEQIPAEEFAVSLGTEAKVLPAVFGNYKIVEAPLPGASPENAEGVFMQAIANLS